jgi:hypothetical protein
MNTGLDAICELTNTLDLDYVPGVSRYLMQFDTTEILDIFNNKISGKSYDVYLRNYIAEANGINFDTTLEIYPLAQSWNNGTGYYANSPQTQDGASWTYSSYSGSNPWSISGTYGPYAYTGSYNTGSVGQGGGNWFTTSSFKVTQSFGLRSTKDIDVSVKNTVTAWYSSSIPNYGFIAKLTGSIEFNPSEYVQPDLKFYSVDTNTIYPPSLIFYWNDQTWNLTSESYSRILSNQDFTATLGNNRNEFQSNEMF